MFWENFKNLCKSKGETPNGVCKALKFSNATATHWKNGKSPNAKSLQAIANYFDVPVDYLLRNAQEPETEDENDSNMQESSNMFWKNYLKLCKDKGLSPTAVAKGLNFSSGSVTEWKKGRIPSKKTLQKLADFFKVSVEYFFIDHSESNSEIEKEPESTRRPGVRIPVYGNVAAGVPILAIENYDSDDPDDWEEITEKMANTGEYFALRIHGDSMEPKISNGDIVIVRIQQTIESGETAIVRINGDEATCKKVKRTPEGMMLISTNPVYEPMFFTPKQVQELPVEIIGKVVELRAKF